MFKKRIIVTRTRKEYPDNDYNEKIPRPTTFFSSNFVLRNRGLIDNTLVFDIKLLKNQLNADIRNGKRVMHFSTCEFHGKLLVLPFLPQDSPSLASEHSPPLASLAQLKSKGGLMHVKERLIYDELEDFIAHVVETLGYC